MQCGCCLAEYVTTLLHTRWGDTCSHFLAALVAQAGARSVSETWLGCVQTRLRVLTFLLAWFWSLAINSCPGSCLPMVPVMTCHGTIPAVRMASFTAGFLSSAPSTVCQTLNRHATICILAPHSCLCRTQLLAAETQVVMCNSLSLHVILETLNRTPSTHCK